MGQSFHNPPQPQCGSAAVCAKHRGRHAQLAPRAAAPLHADGIRDAATNGNCLLFNEYDRARQVVLCALFLVREPSIAALALCALCCDLCAFVLRSLRFCALRCALCAVRFVLCAVRFCAVRFALLCRALCAFALLRFALCAVRFALCALRCALCAVRFVLCALRCLL